MRISPDVTGAPCCRIRQLHEVRLTGSSGQQASEALLRNGRSVEVNGANRGQVIRRRSRADLPVTVLAATGHASVSAPPFLEQTRSVDAWHLLGLLDVQMPYVARFSALQLIGDRVRAFVEPETENPYEVDTPMAHGEMLRHVGVVGEIACAAVNPVAERHFYLATKATVNLAAPPGAVHILQPSTPGPCCPAVEFEAYAIRFGRGMAVVNEQIFLPATSTSPRQLYIEAKVHYLVMTQATFRAYVAAETELLADMSALGDWQSYITPSPYVDPIYLTEIEAPSEHERTAMLHFNDPRMVLGHFPDVPAMPASTILANAIRLLAEGFGNPEDGPARFTVAENSMRFHRMPLLGETLAITCTRADRDPCSFLCCIRGKHDGKDVVVSQMRVALHAPTRRAERLPQCDVHQHLSTTLPATLQNL